MRVKAGRRLVGTNPDPVCQSLESSRIPEDREAVWIRIDDVVEEVDRLDDDLERQGAKSGVEGIPKGA